MPPIPTMIEDIPDYSPGRPLEHFDETLIPKSLTHTSVDGIRHAWAPTTVVHAPDLPAKYCRAPYLAILPDQTWVCFFQTGGETEPRPDNYIGAAQSADQGKTWSKVFTLFEAREYLRRTTNGAPLLINGRAGIIFQTAVNGSYCLEQRAMISWYNQKNKRWSFPKYLPGVPNIHAMPGFQAMDGSYVVPVYWAEGCGQLCPGDIGGTKIVWQTEWPNGLEQTAAIEYRHVCGVIVSRDNGETFGLRGHVSADGVNLWEPTVAEIAPDHWVMLMRAETTGFLYQSTSNDSGHTWSKPVPSGIIDPSTKPQFLKIGKNVALFCNPNPGLGFIHRKQVEVWISDDGLKSWKSKIPVANAIGSDRPACYPHATYLPESHEIAMLLDTARNVYLQRIPCSKIGIERP